MFSIKLYSVILIYLALAVKKDKISISLLKEIIPLIISPIIHLFNIINYQGSSVGEWGTHSQF